MTRIKGFDFPLSEMHKLEDLNQGNNLMCVKNITLRATLSITINMEAGKEAIKDIRSKIMVSWTSSKTDILSQVRTGQLS